MVRIKQVMLNYASNAIKYTECGQIDITISFGEEHDGYIDMTYMVRDTGQGIKKEDTSYYFAPQNVRVLLVDDNRLNREVVKELLAPLEMVIDVKLLCGVIRNYLPTEKIISC